MLLVSFVFVQVGDVDMVDVWCNWYNDLFVVLLQDVVECLLLFGLWMMCVEMMDDVYYCVECGMICWFVYCCMKLNLYMYDVLIVDVVKVYFVGFDCLCGMSLWIIVQ